MNSKWTVEEIRKAIKRATEGGYCFSIVTEETPRTRTEVGVWHEKGRAVYKGRVVEKGPWANIDSFDPCPEPIPDSFLLKHAEAIMEECTSAPRM